MHSRRLSGYSGAAWRLGSRLNAMYEFHTRRGIEARRGQYKRDANGAVIRWCFADEATESGFARQFN